MPKAKRQKMDAGLSHKDMWDDSALLSSWDAALEEYQKYHSLHARGISVTEALDRHDAAEAAGSKDTVEAVFKQEDADQEMVQDDAEALDGDIVASDETNTENKQQEQDSDALNEPQASKEHYAEANASYSHPGGVPAALFNGVGPAADNPALKHLMMSWYYAGYYTGLHEGEQNALAQARGGQSSD